MTLLAEVAAVSEALAATSSRLAKRAELGALLRRLGPDEIEPVVALLTGEFRQGRIGVGWATMAAVDPGPAPAEPQLTVAGLDAAVDAIMGTTGGGSAAARTELLTDLLGRATAAERVLVRRLFGEGLRQGALDGVMTDAVAAAAGCPVDDVRRAAMLTGSLPTAACRSCAASNRCSRRPHRGSPPPLPSWASARSSGSSTAPGSRCTATTTRSASSPARSTT
jgi:DNA ligase-1